MEFKPILLKGQLYYESRKTFNKIPYILISVMNNYEHDDSRLVLPTFSCCRLYYYCGKLYIRSI